MYFLDSVVDVINCKFPQWSTPLLTRVVNETCNINASQFKLVSGSPLLGIKPKKCSNLQNLQKVAVLLFDTSLTCDFFVVFGDKMAITIIEQIRIFGTVICMCRPLRKGCNPHDLLQYWLHTLFCYNNFVYCVG